MVVIDHFVALPNTREERPSESILLVFEQNFLKGSDIYLDTGGTSTCTMERYRFWSVSTWMVSRVLIATMLTTSEI